MLFEIHLTSDGQYRKVYIRATDELHAAQLVNEKIPGKVLIKSIEVKGAKNEDQDNSN